MLSENAPIVGVAALLWFLGILFCIEIEGDDRMLRKIDCVMIRVDDLEAAKKYYIDVFGLRPTWQDEISVGLGFPETDAEIVLHCDPGILSRVEVHYLVNDVASAVQVLAQKGCTVLVEPFDIPIGMCTVIKDLFGTRMCLLDMSKGPREPYVG
jgi:predicted enzyme related to lactoylglutathione lyase